MDLQSAQEAYLGERAKSPERPRRDSIELTPLTPRVGAPSEEVFIQWRLVQPRGDESCRWERFDGYWVALTLDAMAGNVVVADADGRAEHVPSYEGALSMAARWRR
ncbi:MAG TPA: hypothetical protein VFF06_25800 [Polyangia bacterium]|nr:hypothetical protein [Polyangia bacterium]